MTPPIAILLAALLAGVTTIIAVAAWPERKNTNQRRN